VCEASSPKSSVSLQLSVQLLRFGRSEAKCDSVKREEGERNRGEEEKKRASISRKRGRNPERRRQRGVLVLYVCVCVCACMQLCVCVCVCVGFWLQLLCGFLCSCEFAFNASTAFCGIVCLCGLSSVRIAF